MASSPHEHGGKCRRPQKNCPHRSGGVYCANGIRGYMAVVVNMRNKKYYVHRLVLPDGSAFKLEENKNADQEPQRGVPERS